MKTLSIVLAVCGALLPGCKKQAPPPAAEDAAVAAPTAPTPQPIAPTKVTLQLNWTPEPEFGGFYAGVHKGIYGQHGLDVDVKAGAAGIQTWKMVATGNVPFGIAEAGEILRANAKDANLVALYAVYQDSPQGLMVHKESGVANLGEVFTSGKIKKVALESGLPYVKFLEKKYGFGKVEVMQYGGNLSLFLSDKSMAQQCFVFGEPVSAKEKGVEVATFSTAEAGFNPYLAVVITSRGYLEKNRAVVDAFVKATAASWEDYLKDPASTNQFMKEKGSPMTISAMAIAAELQKPFVTGATPGGGLGRMSAERWQELASQLKELGELTEIPDVSKILGDKP